MMMKNSRIRKTITSFVALLVLVLALGSTVQNSAYAQFGTCYGRCDCPGVGECNIAATTTSEGQKNYTNKKDGFTEHEFQIHQEWMVKVFFEMHILPAMMLFAEQITAMAMHQVVVIGSFLDAKHQLETQRLFQEMTAQAHKDYHPSEGMCTFGTNIRSLAASDRNTDLSAIAISNRVLQRELLSGNAVSGSGRSSDVMSRLKQFREIYCNPKDNGNGLELLCPNIQDANRVNKDIDYTSTFDAPLTLKMDFTNKGVDDHKTNKHSGTDISADEEDVFALSANLYAHTVAPVVPAAFLSDENGAPNSQGAPHYMNIRAIAAKRSVARNSFASIAALKSQGGKEVQPYMFALVKEMGITDEKELKDYLGERPSYYAQMEILTKKLYQNPNFYSELYDKPANVGRKNVSMQAIELMQKRDIYRSILRSEAILSVMLETALIEEQDKIVNETRVLSETAPLISIPE